MCRLFIIAFANDTPRRTIEIWDAIVFIEIGLKF